ncbi:MAG: transposase, partial [Candidatus Sericytochromatia bacterium]|nr:transposase [Candidatus Sericytochromatia bacterium]
VLYDHHRNREINKPLKELKLKPGKDYDLQVKQKTSEYRLLLLWNPQTHCHVRFLTNVPLAYLSAKALGKVYRLRWQVELYFKELKSFSGLGRLLSANQNIIEGLVWASLLTCTLRRFLVFSAQQTQRLSTHKAARSSVCFFPEFLRQWRQYGVEAFTKLFDYLRQVMTLSNPKRRDIFAPFNTAKPLL